MKKLFTLIIILTGITVTFAQSAIVPVGGDAQNNNGSVSYTVGQIAIQTNGNESVSLSEGVQQPYEIMTVGVNDFPQITLNALVYPNPTRLRNPYWRFPRHPL